jgi:hypothetical protein
MRGRRLNIVRRACIRQNVLPIGSHADLSQHNERIHLQPVLQSLLLKGDLILY